MTFFDPYSYLETRCEQEWQRLLWLGLCAHVSGADSLDDEATARRKETTRCFKQKGAVYQGVARAGVGQGLPAEKNRLGKL